DPLPPGKQIRQPLPPPAAKASRAKFSDLLMIKILSNGVQRNHERQLRSWLQGCSDGFIAVAFLKQAGLRTIQEDLGGFLRRGGKMRLLVGTDFFLTEPNALRALANLARDYPNLDWRIIES